jgi:hypothetical protein
VPAAQKSTLPCQVAVKVSLLNFFVTLERVEEQPLGTVGKTNAPDPRQHEGSTVISNKAR